MNTSMDQVVVQPWIPQDDLLLKNAVEAGASLESLAKGAVRFSRKYSVAELRERWLSLLYDPDVSAAASAAMVNLELSGKSGGSGSKEEEEEDEEEEKVGSKRKGMSIRKQYYSRRKAFFRQVFFDSFDMAMMHDEMTLEKNDGVELGGVGGLSTDMNQLIVNNLAKYGNHLGLEEVGPSHSMSEVPLWKTIEDVSVPDMPAMPAIHVQVSPENNNHDPEVRTVVSHGLTGKCVSDELNASAAVLSREDGGHISDSILNLKNEDEPTFIDIDGKDAADKPCYVTVDSLILSTPREIQENDESDNLESQKLHAETTLAVTSRLSATGLEAATNPLECSPGDLNSISDPVNDCQSSAAAQSPHPEQNEKYMICVLNTEDPYVPSNDDVDLSAVVPCLETLKHQPIIKEVGHSDSSISNQRKNEPDRSLKKVVFPSHSFVASQIVRPGPVPNISSSQPPLGVLVRTENPGSNPIPAASRQSDNGNINPSHSRLVRAPITPALVVKQEEIDTLASAEVCAHPREKEHKDLTKSETKSLSLNQEGDDDDDHEDDDDYDNEVPDFSDVEEMILEMDLCPTDQDSNASREVLRYQDENTKRTIMRLEQCIESSMHRSIASHGALAVLYGRHSKQYIKKSKVILGRATDDVPVDIDLGREGPANKISRRQALIKIESDGTFIIQNLGKSPIFLNGKAIATGQQRILTPCSLIEIRSMSFIFDCNNKSVKSFLENVDKRERR